MTELDYTYTFDHIGEKLKKGQVYFTDHIVNKTRLLPVAVDDYQLPFKHLQATPSLLADLIDIAMAVHIADRLSKSKGDMPRRIKIRLPIRHSVTLDRPLIHQKLQRLLSWFTEDEWYFDFIPYAKDGRSSEIRHCLPFSQETIHPRHVVLWSGGLDAFAGVYQQLRNETTTHYTLFGTGGNDMISSVQRRIAKDIGKLFPNRTKVVQLPLRLKASRDLKKSSTARSRGFVFMLLGAVCAYQEGQNTLYIYENGVGAINLPFRESEIGLDHSRSVHPLSLRYMGELLSIILDQSFTFQNPFLFWTKAQICREPLLIDAAKIVFSTISCDSRHHKKPIQCGYCSSCLLRRQAIAFHGIADKTEYQITEALSRQRKPTDSTHYYAMLSQVETIRMLLSTEDRWERMSQRYRSLEDIVENIGEHKAIAKEQILRLYQNYIQEWDSVKSIIGHAFLEGRGQGIEAQSILPKGR